MKKSDHYFIGLLNSFKRRKGMYIQPVNVENVQSFLCGFSVAAGLPSFFGLAEENGWKRISVGPVPEMRSKGMTDEQIMDELIDIQLTALKP